MKVNSIYVLSLIIMPVLTDKRNIMKNSKVKSWISTENFTTIVKKSFLYSKCCNIFISGLYTCVYFILKKEYAACKVAFLLESIFDVEVIFHQFINIYPYEYLLHKIFYDCQGYFLLGPTDKEIEKTLQRIPSSISTTEILVIINDEVKDTSNLFNVSLYGNSNANIVSRSGIWTLSENYLAPRFFLKVNSYDELMSEFNLINMKGRELQVRIYYEPPFSYRNKKIFKSVEEEVFLANNDEEMDGIEMKMFLVIAEKLNFTWTRYLLNSKENSTYERLEGDFIQLIQEKKVDIAFGNIWLMQKSNQFVNMSIPCIDTFIHFLVPRPQPITNFWALTRPFSVDCWILIIIMLFVNSIYMYIRAKIDPKFPKRFRNFFFTITELMGRLIGTWVPRNTANARFELHLWQITGLLLVTAYCSSLAARLTSSEYENKIDTIRQFLEANLSWGISVNQMPYWPDYFDMKDPYMSQLPSRFISTYNQKTYIHTLMKKNKYAIIGTIIHSTFFTNDGIFHEDLKDYRLMADRVSQIFTSFAVQPWLLRPIDTVILRMKESGIEHFHLDDVIRRRVTFNFLEIVKEYDSLNRRPRILGLTPLGAGFTVLIVGLLVSTIVFFYELKQAADSRSIHEVFRDIQKKRKAYKSSIYKKKNNKEII